MIEGCYTTVGTLIDVPKNYMYSVVKLEYKLDPPLYQEDCPQDKFFIKEVFGEGTSIIKDCYNAYSEAIDEVLDQTKEEEEVFAVKWYHFGTDEFVNFPLCKRSKGSGLFFGEKTIVRVKGQLVKKSRTTGDMSDYLDSKIERNPGL